MENDRKKDDADTPMLVLIFMLANVFWFFWFGRPILALFTRLVTALEKIANI